MTFLPPAPPKGPSAVKVEPKRHIPMRHLKIASPNGTGAAATIEVDGEPVTTLTSVRFKIEGGDFARAELSFVPSALEFDGQAELEVSYAIRSLLIKLGWTPPA